MNKFIPLLVILTFFIVYYFTIILVQVDHETFFTSLYWDNCDILRRSPTPAFAVATKRKEDPFTFKTFRLTLDNCNYGFHSGGGWKLEYRPLVGDHIHLGIAIHVNGKDVTLRDRNMTEPVPYEDFNATCANPPAYAYTKEWYHTGVHTHCDDVIHVHPWSAPRKLRVTGKEVTLGMWFESVGIDVGSLSNTLRIPGYGYMDKWVLQYYTNVSDSFPSYETLKVEEMSNLWLVDHHGFIKLFRDGDSAPDKSLKVLNFYSKSKLGSKYPTRN